MNRNILYVLGAFGVGGLIDALYLYSKSITGSPLSCSLIKGCNIVAASSYSKVFGVPLSLFGVFFYIGVLGLVALSLYRPTPTLRKLLFMVTIVGVLFSAYFTYLQAFVIQAFCQYCLISATTSLILFGLTAWYVRTRTYGLQN